MEHFVRTTILFGAVVCLLAIAELPGGAAVSITRADKTCQEYPVELREEKANIVLSGYINKIMRKPRTIMYDCDIEVVRVFKGYEDLHENSVAPPMEENRIQVGGFGDPSICDNTVTRGDTRIFMVNKNGNGHLMLNSSVIRITLNNLVQAEAAVFDVPFVTKRPERRGPCDMVLCIYGAVCIENEYGRPQCVCQKDCPEMVAPVCGSDGTTYLSECFLDRASCEEKRMIYIESQGACDEKDPCEDVQCSFGSECVVENDRASCVCQDICLAQFEPVCGSDGVTYSSECQLRLAACNLQKDITSAYIGECEVRDPCDEMTCSFGSECVLEGDIAKCMCPEVCIEIYSPVCGSDGMDYANMCNLNVAACAKQKNISVVFNGQCDPCQGVEFESGVCKLDRNRDPQPSCDLSCATQFDPVCGSDGVTYSHVCILHREACVMNLDGVLIPYTEGACEEGSHPCADHTCAYGQCFTDESGIPQCVCVSCPEIYDPVCGSDAQTYHSSCHLKRESCLTQTSISQVLEGSCPLDAVVTCPTPACEAMEGPPSPVCGSDGVDYDSLCALQTAACDQDKDIQVAYNGYCGTCETTECYFGAFCQMTAEGPTCKCSEQCKDVEMHVCGSDGQTYNNECQLNVRSCKLQENITVISYGPCEDCLGVVCDVERYNQVCFHGMCRCQEMCVATSFDEDKVCGSDEVTYDSLCHLQRAACQEQSNLTVDYYGPCDEDEMSGSGSGDEEVTTESLIDCDETFCNFGGIFRPVSPFECECVCRFNCPAVRLSVCGTDGVTYGNDCQLKEAACEQQTSIILERVGTCEDVDPDPCDGDTPLTRVDGSQYTCQETNRGEDCPSGSYCHIHPLGAFSVCCPVGEQTPTPPPCTESQFGCCPDNETEALGENYAGCPSVCNCNPQGSYNMFCEPQTQQCSCKPGVGGKDCSRCEPGFYDLNDGGCRSCDCSPDGSRRDDCDQTTGACKCKKDVQGLKCNVCPEGLVMTPMGCAEAPPAEISCDNVTCPYNAVCRVVGENATCSCPTSCPTEPSWVCGSDGQTYASRCQLEVMACREQTDIMVRYEGECETVLPTPPMPKPGCELTTHGCCQDNQTVARGPNYEGCTPTGTPAQAANQGVGGASTPPPPPLPVTTMAPGVASSSTAAPSSTPLSFSTTAYVTANQYGPSTPTPTEIVLGCTSNPCMHGGTCQNDLIAPGFSCSCPVGRGGPVCETVVTFETPSFSGDSYLAYPAINAFSELEIIIEFQTNATEGVLLYEAQNEEGRGDFVSLGIVNNQVEFRFQSTDQSNGFDLGTADPVVIRSDVQLEPLKWHRVRAYRMRRDGTLSVDEEPEVTGSSQGASGALNLGEELFIGHAVPAEVGLSLVGVSQGFVGCIRHVEVNDKIYDITSKSATIEYGANVGQCGNDPCQKQPCLNNGTCEAVNAETYRCICVDNFLGPLCGDVLVDQCEGNMCHSGSSCAPLAEGGYRCDCQEGWMGELCDEQEIGDGLPAFIGNSYFELSSLMMPTTTVIEVEFITKSPEGVIFYNGQATNGLGDFISLNLRDGYLEYRYDLGAGIADIRSPSMIPLNVWQTVRVSRGGVNGEMVVNDDTPITGSSPPGASQLNLRDPLFIGGIRNYDQISRKAGITDGLTGSIRMFAAGGEEYADLRELANAAVNIEDYKSDVKNIAIQTTQSSATQSKPDPVAMETTMKPSLTTATVQIVNTDDPVSFDGQTTLTYYNGITKKQRALRTHTLQVTFKTSSPNGVLLWNGRGSADFQAVAVVDGNAQFAYNLGRGIARVTSSEKVDDDMWHTVTITRNLVQASLQVDDGTPIMGQSRAGASQLDTDGILQLGSANGPPSSMSSSYIPYSGCIGTVLLDEEVLHLYEHVQGEKPTQFCPSS